MTASPRSKGFLAGVASPLLLGSIVIGLLLFAWLPPVAWHSLEPPAPPTGAFLALWTLIPPRDSLRHFPWPQPTKLFAERYYLTSAPALALLAGAVSAPRSSRLAPRPPGGFLGSYLCPPPTGGSMKGFSFRGTVDWKGGIRTLREQIGSAPTPVLAVPGFNEAATVAAVTDPRLTEVLFFRPIFPIF